MVEPSPFKPGLWKTEKKKPQGRFKQSLFLVTQNVAYRVEAMAALSPELNRNAEPQALPRPIESDFAL